MPSPTATLLLLLAFLGLAALNPCAASEDVKNRSLRKVLPRTMGKELTLIASADPADGRDLYPFSQTGGVVLSRLTGRWFQTQGSIFIINNMFCTTVDYDSKGLSDGPFADTSLPIRVTVSSRFGSVSGPLQQTMGSATSTAYNIEEIPGILYGIYASGSSTDADALNPGIFVVQATGATNIRTRNYEFVVVSDPTKSFSLVLAQNVEEYKEKYEATVLTWMAGNGFTDLWNRPYPIEQDNCNYPAKI